MEGAFVVAALALSGLFVAGAVDVATEWRRTCSNSMQGPYAQAHFTESFIAPESKEERSKRLRQRIYQKTGHAYQAATSEPIVDRISEWTLACLGISRQSRSLETRSEGGAEN